MKFFNVGIPELLFLLLLAFVLLGPQKAAKSAAKAGQWLRDLVNSPLWQELLATSEELKDLPKKIMDEAEILSTIEGLESLPEDLTIDNKTIEKELRDQHQIDPPSKG